MPQTSQHASSGEKNEELQVFGLGVIASTRGVLALFSLLMMVSVYAQTTWIWQPQCPIGGQREWFTVCTGGVCSSTPYRIFHYNNWGQVSCGPDGLTFPGVGDDVRFLSGADAKLRYRAVNVRSILVAEGAVFGMTGPTLALQDPATNAPGVITNRGTTRFEGGDTTTLSCLFLNEGALEVTGSIHFSNGVLRNPAGRTMQFFGGNITAAANTTNLLENYGTLRKVGTFVYWIGAPMLQRDATVVIEPNGGDLRLAGPGVHERVVWNLETNCNLDLEVGQTFIDTHWQIAANARPTYAY